ncbi:MAG: ribbon-helix-helix protein, CopG family [Myxococcales bacterium]|nr:ribbon-helix-helix protein, CopG family [Myxococcales bacterium]
MSVKANAKPERPKVRLSLDVSPEMYDLLTELAAKTHGTKSEVIRKSVALMELAVAAKERGKKFGIATSTENLETEIVGI